MHRQKRGCILLAYSVSCWHYVCQENRRMTDLMSVLFIDRLVLFVLLVEHVFHDFQEGRLSDQMFDKTHYSA